MTNTPNSPSGEEDQQGKRNGVLQFLDSATVQSSRPWLLPVGAGLALAVAFGLGRCSGTSPQITTPSDPSQTDTSQVREGKPMEGVKMSEAQLRSFGIELIEPERSSGAERPISGFVEAAVGGSSAVGVPVAGRIRKLLVAPGDAVRAGQPIAAVVSPEAAMIYAELEVSRAQAKLVDGQYRRMLSLAKKGYLPWQELENKRIEIVRANAEVRAAAAKASTADSPDASGNVLFKSPISGQVTAVKMLPGSFVQAGEVVAEISNPGATELHFVVTPILGESIKVGELLRVTAGSREFQARVTSVGSGGSGANRGTLLRAQPINATTPPAGTAVTAFPVVNAADIRLTVPSGAVQTLNGSPVVFLYEKGVARPLSVAIGKQTGGRTEILSGLKGGETLAGSNTYVLKTELERSRP